MKHKSLAAALAAFQANLPGVGKDSVNPHFKSRYADLADMSKAILPVLAAEGLAFTSMPTLTDRGFVLAYQLMHEGGQSVDGEYPLNSAGNDQQKGSSITYARRYALGAVTGVAADDDDDGHAASQVKQAQPPTQWKEWVVQCTTPEALSKLHQRAVQEGWVNQMVLAALTKRKNEIADG